MLHYVRNDGTLQDIEGWQGLIFGKAENQPLPTQLKTCKAVSLGARRSNLLSKNMFLRTLVIQFLFRKGFSCKGAEYQCFEVSRTSGFKLLTFGNQTVRYQEIRYYRFRAKNCFTSSLHSFSITPPITSVLG